MKVSGERVCGVNFAQVIDEKVQTLKRECGMWGWCAPGTGMGWMWIFPFLFFLFMMGMMGMFWWRGFRRPWTGMGHFHETPRQILDRRYASGEVTQQQYEEMKRNLATS
jgi:putative membrane protein